MRSTRYMKRKKEQKKCVKSVSLLIFVFAHLFDTGEAIKGTRAQNFGLESTHL